ncbi:MAG TPA: FAD-dependent oxidoreductase [Allosphingosinicella sp.]|uniref:NAD(P)/FAD-dependent oxidoreductase n=1 Tax=Allosphingosinicella sp. TaxID=2823234 RepID=UPI002F29EC8A
MKVQIAIVGAGMAGASLAAALAPHASVLLLEAEARPGYHATGRSAAFWSESYGGPFVQPLTTASRPFLAESGFLKPRGCIHLADEEGRQVLSAMEEEFAGSGLELRRLDRGELEQRFPRLRPSWKAGLSEPSCADIDVASLHAEYLKKARTAGARLVTDAELIEARRTDGGWQLSAKPGLFTADILVNAAGAWADQVALRAGMTPLGIRPYRRTVAQLRVDPPAPADMPLVIDALGRFYFKPEAGGRIWLSPHDETACEPCDTAPEELDVALAIDRLGQVVDWRVVRVEHSWAGLRSFAPDRLPVYGFASGRSDFFWCVGQGGFGIQTAPAAAALAAALLLGVTPGPPAAGIDPSLYSAGRFTN